MWGLIIQLLSAEHKQEYQEAYIHAKAVKQGFGAGTLP